MKIVELLRVDSKGRVTIPRTVRDALNIVEGGYVIMIADLNKNEIVLTPTGGGNGKLLDLRVIFEDVKGKLAEISEELAKLGADQVSTSCRTIKKGGEAECTFIIEVPEELSKEEVEEAISSIKGVKEVVLTSLPSH
jgi:AbrB family looped-hinge helix DNA binding protein